MEQLIFGIVSLTLFGLYIRNMLKKQKQQRLEKGIVFESLNSTYIGGFPDINGGTPVNVVVYKDKIEFTTTFNNNRYATIVKSMNMNDIQKVFISTKSQIQASIGLGKMLVFGVLAFAMAGSKTVVKNYLVMNYKYEDDIISIVLDTSQNEELVKIINELKN